MPIRFETVAWCKSELVGPLLEGRVIVEKARGALAERLSITDGGLFSIRHHAPARTGYEPERAEVWLRGTCDCGARPVGARKG